MEEIAFQTINGNLFTVSDEVITNQFCSVRETGYLIVPDGRLIVVPSGKKHHGMVFLEYISKYLELSEEELKEKYCLTSDNGLTYIPLLNSLGLISYFGVGLGVNITARGFDSSEFYNMHGMLNIPEETEQLTAEQLVTCQKLLETNISFTGKEKYPIEIGDIVTGAHYTINDIDTLLKEKVGNYKK